MAFSGCKQSGTFARVKQREWKKHRVDTIEAAPAIAAPGFYTLGYFLPLRPGRGSRTNCRKFPHEKNQIPVAGGRSFSSVLN
jgi:hypothetical protein